METKKFKIPPTRTLLIAAVLGGVFLIGTSARAASPTVQTAQGAVVGTQSSSGLVNEFLGVPYAAAPVGALRFVAPQPHASWSTPLSTTQFAQPCPQVMPPSTPVGAEDCLYLNVYTPANAHPNTANAHPNTLPVMVFYPGGVFIAGTAGAPFYDSEFIAKQGNVVVVTVSYRLGALGFLPAPSLDAENPHHVSGNYGLLDQQRALHWVKQNIGAFGGNANNVTIFGESAGANSVEHQLTSPLVKGLFKQAIVESAAGLAAIPDPTLAALEAGGGASVIGQVGCAGAPNVPACLRALPAYAFLNTSASNPQQPALGPVVDGYVIPMLPLVAFISGQFNQVPIIIGSNHDEMTALVWQIEAQGGPLSAAAYNAMVTAQFGPLAPTVLGLYPASNYASPIQAYATLGTDANFACPTEQKRAAMAQYVPVFGYEFNEPNPAAGPLLGPPMPGLTYGDYHTSELPYVFGVSSPNGVPVTGKDLALSHKMIALWTSFASTSYPLLSDSPHWHDYLSNSMLSLQDSITQKSVSSFVSDHKCSFWNNLPPP